MGHVLLIEDNVDRRSRYEQRLKDEGHRVIAAANAWEGLAWLRLQRPDVLVLDIDGGQSGVEVISQILATREDLPVVVHTADPDQQHVPVAWSADEFVLKNNTTDKLAESVDRCLRVWRR